MRTALVGLWFCYNLSSNNVALPYALCSVCPTDKSKTGVGEDCGVKLLAQGPSTQRDGISIDQETGLYSVIPVFLFS